MQLNTILKEMGLTEGEVKVYLALLNLGKSTAGPITKEAKVSPSKIYDILARLLEKGIINYSIEGKIRFYKVMPLIQLLSFLKEKKESFDMALEAQERQLEKVIPELEAKRLSKKEEEYAEIYEGIRGIKAFFDLSLIECQRGDELCVVGYSKIASQIFNAYFKEYNKKRAKKGIIAKVIFDYDAWFGKKREKRKLAYYRYLPKTMKTPAFIYIFKDRVGTIIITENQKLCFMIKNKEVAESYKHYFNLVWKSAIKI